MGATPRCASCPRPCRATARRRWPGRPSRPARGATDRPRRSFPRPPPAQRPDRPPTCGPSEPDLRRRASAARPEVSDLIGPDETAFRLELTAAQLKIVHTALKSLYDDLGHEEHDVKQVVQAVLAKLPGEHEIRAIDLDRELRGPTPAGPTPA